MKAQIKKIGVYKTDNEYYNVTINQTDLGKFEKSELRHLIEILDNAIH